MTQTSAVVGGRVRVECFVENLQGDEVVQSISWTHDGVSVEADVSVEVDKVAVSSLLEIEDAVIGDAGVYVCTVRFTQPEIVELDGSVVIAIQSKCNHLLSCRLAQKNNRSSIALWYLWQYLIHQFHVKYYLQTCNVIFSLSFMGIHPSFHPRRPR